MTVAACLLLYGFAIAVLAPALLTRLTRAGMAPRCGVVAWLVVMGSVLLSWVAAAATLTVELLRSWTQPGTIVSACMTTLRAVAVGDAGMLLQFAVMVFTTFAVTAVAVMGWRWVRSLARARTHTHEHARMARMVGRQVPGHDAIVLDSPERLAYCAAGRPHAIVVSSAALDALDQSHLSAVLAHERAHLAGRHHLLLAATRGLATILSKISLFTTGAAEIARLLEMCADDAAARTHSPRTVLGALLALSGAAPVPHGALGAAGVAVLARAERLAEPPARAQCARMRLLLAGVIALVVTGPLLTGLLAAHNVATCYPVGL